MKTNPVLADSINRLFTQVQTIITQRMSQAGIRGSTIHASHLIGTPPSTVIKSVTAAPSSVFGASGAGHSQGVVPDPGAIAGTSKFLREDATWDAPSGGGGSAVSQGAYGSEPSSPAVGDLYLPNNSLVAEDWDGTVWQPWGPIQKLKTPPSAGWTTINGGGVTLTNANGSIYMSTPASRGNPNYCAYVRSAPATPYTVTALFLLFLNASAGNFCTGSMCFLDGATATNKFITWGPWANNQFVVSHYNNVTSQNAFPLNSGIAWNVDRVWLRMTDDGTNLTFYWSADGLHFLQIFQESRTAWFAAGPTHVGVTQQNSTGFPVSMTIPSWDGA